MMSRKLFLIGLLVMAGLGQALADDAPSLEEFKSKIAGFHAN